MFKLFHDEKLIEKNDYATAKISKIVNISEYGLNDSWYGGNINFIAELKDSSLFLIVSKDLKTIEVGTKNKRLYQKTT